MPRALPLVSAALLLGLTTACDIFPFGSGPGEAPREITELPRALTQSEAEVLRASNAFGFDLLREIVRSEPASSHFISPLSASMALGMTLNGASGETFDAMRGALRFDGLSEEEINASYRGLIDLLTDLDPRVSFQIANSVWHRPELVPLESFASALERSFDAEVRGIDFASAVAASTINDWVRDRTNGRIEEIVEDPIPWDVVMYLLNAIHFKGDWTAQFDPDRTREGDFHLPDGSTARVRFMTRTDGFRMGAGPGYTAADLPYGGKAFSMTVVVPAKGGSLPELVEALDDEGWAAIVGSLHDAQGGARLYLPRFTLEWERTLNEVLEALGMGVAFRDGEADFSRIFGFFGPFISEVKQKSFIQVDEEGTEAAAVTSVEIGLTSAPPEVRLDRPFLLAIRERLSGTILFLGAISEAPTD
jgi:serine protease inhibitor